jgi:hypothetical protein
MDLWGGVYDKFRNLNSELRICTIDRKRSNEITIGENIPSINRKSY